MHAAEPALPAPDTLTEEQRRGAACVRCATPLGPTAVDLGVRPDPGCPWAAWFPRACPPCAGARR